jgi:Glycosyl hydrolases family 16
MSPQNASRTSRTASGGRGRARSLAGGLAGLLLTAAWCCTAAPAHAATVTVTEDSLSVAQTTIDTSTSVSATLKVHASGTLAVQALTVAVRSADGTGYDFLGASPETLGTSELTFTPEARTFPAGTYTYFGAYEVGGAWTDLPSQTLTVEADTPTGIAGSWTSVFDDDFGARSLAADPDWSTVSPFGIMGKASNGWCPDSGTAGISGGYLTLEALAQSCEVQTGTDASGNPVYTDQPITSGIVSTDPGLAADPFTIEPGDAIEARIYQPASSGSSIANWPAFWADGQNWPEDGEIDAMEGIGGTAQFHVHFGTAADPLSDGKAVAGNYTGWHTYGAQWLADGTVDFYYDGVNVGSATMNPATTAPQYLVLDLATGGSGGVTVTGSASQVKVAYVRAWQPS